MHFPEFAKNHESQWEFQLITSKILPSLPGMAKESSLQAFPINWFAEGVYRVVVILQKTCVRMTVYWSVTCLPYLSRKT